MACEELTVAATKSYSAQLAAIAMLSAAWSDHNKLWQQIKQIPAFLGEVLDRESQIQTIASLYRAMDQCVVLGRDFNYATTLKWSPKLKELAYVVAQPYSSADFIHGPITWYPMVFPSLSCSPGRSFRGFDAFVRETKRSQRADLFLLSEDQELLQLADCPLPLPDGIPEWLSPLDAIVPAQLFSYYLTLKKHWP